MYPWACGLSRRDAAVFHGKQGRARRGGAQHIHHMRLAGEVEQLMSRAFLAVGQFREGPRCAFGPFRIEVDQHLVHDHGQGRGMGRVVFDVGQAQGQIGLFLRAAAQGFRRHRFALVGQNAQARIFQRGADAPPAAARDAGEDVRGLADDLRLALALKNALGVEQDFAGQGPTAPGQSHTLHAFQQQRFLLAQFRQIVGPGQGRNLGAQTGCS